MSDYLPWELAARAVTRDSIRGQYPDTNSGRAKEQAYVEERWRGKWFEMHIKANWRRVFDVR